MNSILRVNNSSQVILLFVTHVKLILSLFFKSRILRCLESRLEALLSTSSLAIYWRIPAKMGVRRFTVCNPKYGPRTRFPYLYEVEYYDTTDHFSWLLLEKWSCILWLMGRNPSWLKGFHIRKRCLCSWFSPIRRVFPTIHTTCYESPIDCITLATHMNGVGLYINNSWVRL